MMEDKLLDVVLVLFFWLSFRIEWMDETKDYEGRDEDEKGKVPSHSKGTQFFRVSPVATD